VLVLNLRQFAAAFIALVLLVLVAFSTSTPIQAAGVVTNCANDSDLSAKLGGGGLVTFSCGVATIPWTGTKTIAANTTIDGGGNISLSGVFGYRLFVVNSGVTLTLKNITLMRGYNPDSLGGAGVRNNGGHLVLDRVTMHSMVDSAFDGGAIGTIGAVDITNSTFYNNKATNGGAMFGSGSAAVISIENSKLYENAATGTGTNQGQGGAIYVYNGARVNIESSDLYNNDARRDGGAIFVAQNSTAVVTASQIRDNEAESNGGGIYSRGSVNIGGSQVLRNRADYAGGLGNENGSLTVNDSWISGNSANVAGGGGIANGNSGTGSVLTLSNSTVSGNFASGTGGGVSNSRGTATLTNVTISDNNAYSGGGMWNLHFGTAALYNVTIVGNRAISAENGGGLGNTDHADTQLYLQNVLIANNKDSNNCVFGPPYGKPPETSKSNLSSDGTCGFGAGRDNVKIKVGPLETNGGTNPTHRLLPGSAPINKGMFDQFILTDQRGVTRPQGGIFDVGSVEFLPCSGVPPKPQRLSPAKNGQALTLEVVIDWAGPDCVKKFSIVVRRDTKQGPVVFSKTNIKQTQVTTTPLVRNHNYFWQVTACNGQNCTKSKWSKFLLTNP
jgi:hypothetical protein